MVARKPAQGVEQTKKETEWNQKDKNRRERDKIVLKQECPGVPRLLKVVDVVIQVDEDINHEQGKGADPYRPKHLPGKVSIECARYAVAECRDCRQQAEDPEKQGSQFKGDAVAVGEAEKVDVHCSSLSRNQSERCDGPR